MIIGLLGMSGAGKSSWAARLATAGFSWLHCDDLIAARIRQSFDIGAGSVYDLGSWMGLPFEPRYPEREAIYLAHETAVLRTIADALGTGDESQNVVIDMTGSAIYVDPEVTGRIRAIATIVYLAVSAESHARMVEEYIASPRPVLWHGLYQPRPGEPPATALARCYPKLLSERAELYARLSHLTIEEAQHRDPAFDAAALLRLIGAGVR